VVKIGDLGGLVESMNLRVTQLRDLEGRVIFIPNGEIKSVINYTKGYSQALLDIGVAYKEKVDDVMRVMKDLAKEMRGDSYFGKLILGDMEMLGVDAFVDSAVIIKCRMKTLPIKQWEVAREYRRRLKNKFDELGIQIPFPHRTLYWGAKQAPNSETFVEKRVTP
jgi:small conductance mechanosensitive channel